MAGMLTLDISDDGLLIGECEEGKELPIHFSLLNLDIITRIHFDTYGIESSKILEKIAALQESIHDKNY